MARKLVDLDDLSELAQFADEVAATGQPIVLRKRGEDIAVIVPVSGSSRFALGRAKTPEDEEAFLRSAGGWQGIVDEEFMEEVYRSRSVSARPPVEM
jgi:antitoxin (DNA-binding transcriptional repressor) of toxin-antitoxin stability system